MNHFSLPSMPRWPVNHLVLTLAISALVGCSAFNSRQWFARQPAKRDVGNGSMALLGSALPAMKPGDEYELSVIAGRELAAKGFWAEAEEQFRQAEAKAPKKAKLDAELAPVLAALGKTPESIERYRRLIAAAPDNFELRNNYAWTLMESGKLSEAEQEYRSILTIEPDHTRAHVNLGIVLAKQARYQEAFTQLNGKLSDAAAHHNIAIIAIEADHEGVARAALESAVAAEDALPESRQLLAALVKPTCNDQ